jgi:hypothetical protein
VGGSSPVTSFSDKYGEVEFDIDEGIDNLIVRFDIILEDLDAERCNRLRESYSDVYKNLKFSSNENKDFLFEDLVQAIDLSVPAGWFFGPEEEFSAVYRFRNEYPTNLNYEF